MKRVFRGVVSVFMLTVLSLLSLGIHTVAAQPMNMEHSMGTSSHRTSTSNCFTICTTATLIKEEAIKDSDKDEQPHLPYFVQFQTSPLEGYEKKHGQDAKFAIEREPPPGGVPAYISLSVFRA